MDVITIKKNPNGDTRTAPKNVTLKQFRNANVQHREDVKKTIEYLASILENKGKNHDWTKIEYEKEFYEDFLDTINNGTDFVSNKWYQLHIKEEKHHPLSKLHNDFNLLDLIETIVDCICAGKARCGEIRPMEFDDEIVKLAIKNTIKLVNLITSGE